MPAQRTGTMWCKINSSTIGSSWVVQVQSSTYSEKHNDPVVCWWTSSPEVEKTFDDFFGLNTFTVADFQPYPLSQYSLIFNNRLLPLVITESNIDNLRRDVAQGSLVCTTCTLVTPPWLCRNKLQCLERTY